MYRVIVHTSSVHFKLQIRGKKSWQNVSALETVSLKEFFCQNIKDSKFSCDSKNIKIISLGQKLKKIYAKTETLKSPFFKKNVKHAPRILSLLREFLSEWTETDL